MQAFFRYFLNLIPRKILIRRSYLARPIVSLALRGNNFEDPIDNKTYKKFLPYGYENVRENALAPGTLSLERHRLLWLYLKNETPFFTEKLKVLHFAPEQAFYKRFKKLKNLDYATTDLNSPIADVKADICNLPFEDNSYDFIICNHVLEHITDDHQAMKELYRIIKPGGTAILMVPFDENREITYEDPSITDPKERARAFGQYDHVRIYGRDYFDRLRAVGFEVNPVPYTTHFSEKEIQYYSLPLGEVIPVCTK